MSRSAIFGDIIPPFGGGENDEVRKGCVVIMSLISHAWTLSGTAALERGVGGLKWSIKKHEPREPLFFGEAPTARVRSRMRCAHRVDHDAGIVDGQRAVALPNWIICILPTCLAISSGQIQNRASFFGPGIAGVPTESCSKSGFEFGARREGGIYERWDQEH